MRLVLVGPPGSGKGTQGEVLAAHYGVPHISSGELLRRQVLAASDEGKAVAGYLEHGELAPDDIVLALVREAVRRAVDETGGYVLDGFPRNLDQARRAHELAAAANLAADAVVYLRVSDDEVRRRLAERAALGRSDDLTAVIEHRLAVFHAETEPLLEYYQQLGRLEVVDADGSPDAVTAAILDRLSSLGPT